MIFGIIAIFYLLLLLYTNSFKEDKQESLLFHSTKFQNAGAALLGLSVPLLLDVVVNLYNRRVCIVSDGVLIGRVVYTIATYLFGLQLTFQHNIFPTLSSYETSVWFMLSSYRIIFVSTMMFFISITDPLNEISHQTIALTIFGCLVVCINAGTILAISRINEALGNFYILLTIAFLIRRNFQIWKCSTSYSHFLYANILLTFFTLPFCILLMMHIYTSDYNAFPLVSIYLYILVTAILIVIPRWIFNHDAMKLKDEVILATKMSYIRYYSHELRNPMNIVEMGIQFCLNNIPDDSNDNQIKTIRDTLVEVKIACEDSLSIMNDILLYDKLENGLVKLQKNLLMF